jgi:hypothetical protein
MYQDSHMICKITSGGRSVNLAMSVVLEHWSHEEHCVGFAP